MLASFCQNYYPYLPCRGLCGFYQGVEVRRWRVLDNVVTRRRGGQRDGAVFVAVHGPFHCKIDRQKVNVTGFAVAWKQKHAAVQPTWRTGAAIMCSRQGRVMQHGNLPGRLCHRRWPKRILEHCHCLHNPNNAFWVAPSNCRANHVEKTSNSRRMCNRL
jgi:hypothetical protein